MRHDYLDPYRDRDSFVHRLDPRTKLVAACAYVVAVAVVPPGSWPSYAVLLSIVFVWLLASRVPWLHVLRRSLVVFPFVLMIAAFVPFFRDGEVAGSLTRGGWQVSVTYEGLHLLRTIIVRAWLSVTALVLLSATTRMSEMLHAMEALRLPAVLVMVLSFMYRYLFVLVDEIMRLKVARDSRNFGCGGSRVWRVRVVGHMIGSLFIRSYERAERVYSAMVARGFDGRSRILRRLCFRSADLATSVVFVAAIALAAFLAVG